ncbi:hypothetical protein [Streptomyces chilikensis]|uniref:Uncharacterized protein n=1 Tax=Streptomyces chilikensis TaxID=1194079 RepID=A0ABV3EWC1_9ACTN
MTRPVPVVPRTVGAPGTATARASATTSASASAASRTTTHATAGVVEGTRS